MESFLLLSLVILVFVLLLSLKAILKRKQTKRINTYRDKQQHQPIDPNHIILAIEPLHIFIDISNRYRTGYHEILLEEKGLKKLQGIVERWFGYGIYYKLRQQKKNIIGFVQLLSASPKIQLCLYSKIQKEVIDIILKRLEISKYFKDNHQIYSPHDDTKHPTEVDSNTKRVIILTGSKAEFNDQDSKYFLTIKNKELKQYASILVNLISTNGNIDELHSELNDKKIEIQSDYDNDSSHYD